MGYVRVECQQETRVAWTRPVRRFGHEVPAAAGRRIRGPSRALLLDVRLTPLFPLLALPAFCQNFFPLAEGNEWNYRGPRGASLKISVGAPTGSFGRLYFPLTGYAPRALLVRRDDAGTLLQFDPVFKLESPVTVFGPADATFQSGAGFCGEEGTVRGPARLDQWDAVEIRYRVRTCADAGLEQELFAANIGLVRRISQTIAGPVAVELESARIGGLTFRRSAAGPRVEVAVGLAETSLTRPAAGGPLTIQGSIEVAVAGPAALPVQFSSSQRFDVVLIGPDGRQRWVWSADKLFAAVASSEVWTGVTRFEWTMVAPDFEPFEPGVYRVQAWIAAAGDPKRLAATVPVAVQ